MKRKQKDLKNQSKEHQYNSRLNKRYSCVGLYLPTQKSVCVSFSKCSTVSTGDYNAYIFSKQLQIWSDNGKFEFILCTWISEQKFRVERWYDRV